MALFPSRSRTSLRVARLALILAFASVAGSFAQQLKDQPIPFSAWLDFKPLKKSLPRKEGLPIWIESIERINVQGNRTVVRIRLRRMAALSQEMQLKLYFLDKRGAAPTVTGWTETGTRRFATEPLGEGLGVDTSESIIIPSEGLDYLDVEVAGDGKNLRGAFVSSLRKSEVRRALDFDTPQSLLDPFGAPEHTASPTDDLRLFGRVRATIDANPLIIAAEHGGKGTYEFSLEGRPLIAAISFDVLGAAPAEPIDAFVNGKYVGTVSIKFPDLADPAYRGSSSPYNRDMRVRYTGWLNAQVMIPGARLVGGLNNLVLRVSNDSSPIVVRAVEIQLKEPSPTFDYDLHP